MKMREKPVYIGDRIKVVYDDATWHHLKVLRDKAIKIMETLYNSEIPCIVHGSIARGDVNIQSDIDILVPLPIPTFQVELALERGGYEIYLRKIVQATPNHVIKAHIYLDEKTSVTIPLVKMSKRELEFYKFGGSIGLNEIKKEIRVPGIDKRLMLIEPIPEGHYETPIIGIEAIASKKVGVSMEIIQERIRVLSRRDEKGRTGVYLNYVLKPDESFENVLKKIIDKNPIVRRRARYV